MCSVISVILKDNPLTLNGNVIKEKAFDKYLGDQKHGDGISSSVAKTISDRFWRVMSAVLEIKTIIEDYRVHLMGGIMSGIDIWELAVIPSMINNSETWDEIDDDSIKKLDDLQNTLLRYLLQTPCSTPIPALCWEFGMLPMKFRIFHKKLNFLKHIITLGTDTLAKQVYEVQKSENFPGFVTELSKIINDLKLPDITNNDENKEWSKINWEREVKAKVKEKCEAELQKKIGNFKKLKDGPMNGESFHTKDYLKNMTVSEARINFKLLP